MKTHYIIISAIAILAGVWTTGVFTGAYYQHKREMKLQEQIAVLQCKVQALQDSDLKTRLNVGYLQFDVKKLQGK